MKRPNGYGTISKMSGARRKPYAVRVPTHDRKGRVVQKYLSYHATQREAYEALEAYRSKQSAPAPDDLGVRLSNVWELWIDKKSRKLSRNSIIAYTTTWGHLAPLHNMCIRNIGIDQWQSVIDDLEAQGKSQTALNHANGVMRSLSLYALERDWIEKDYAQFIKVPTVGAKVKKDALTREQVDAIAEMASAGDERAASALVLCYTGFRVNEFLDLLCASYDAQERTLTGGSKTDAGRNRIVPVHPRIQPYIDRWMRRGGKYLFSAGKMPGDRLMYERYRSQIFLPLMQDLGIPDATPHWCRHTIATRFKEVGADPMLAKLILGHKITDITEHYTHVTIDQLRSAINLLP